MQPAGEEGVYEDCTNVVLYNSSTGRIGVYCWDNSGDCCIFTCSGEQIEVVPSTIPDVPLERRDEQAGVVRTTICEVVSNPSSFDGKIIEVHAAVLAGLETNLLYDKSCLQGKLPARILFITDEQRVERTSEYRKLWNLVGAYREPKNRRRSTMPDKYTVTATFIGRFNTAGTTGMFIRSHGILAVKSVRDVAAHPLDEKAFSQGANAEFPAKQTGRP